MSAFRFGLASLGRDDGNGRMTIVECISPIEPGRTHRVVAVYDGREMASTSTANWRRPAPSSRVRSFTAPRTMCAIGAAADTDESVLHRGLIRDIAVYDIAATDKWVDHDAQEWGEVADADSKVRPDDDLQFVVRPYLQMATQTSMTVMWETNHPSLGPRPLRSRRGDSHRSVWSRGDHPRDQADWPRSGNARTTTASNAPTPKAQDCE